MATKNNLIEKAYGSVSNRGYVGTLNDLSDHIHKETEVFRSMFLYDNTFKGNTIEPNTPNTCLLYTSPSPRDGLLSRMPSSA